MVIEALAIGIGLQLGSGEPDFDRFPDKLEPCSSLVEAFDADFVLWGRIHKLLGLEPPVDSSGHGYPVVQVYELSEMGESVVIVFVPQYTGPATVEVRASTASIWNSNLEVVDGTYVPTKEPVAVAITTAKTPLPRPLALEISDLVEHYLADVGRPLQDIAMTHGNSYSFVGKSRANNRARQALRRSSARRSRAPSGRASVRS